MAAKQASEEAQLRHGEAPGTGGHCIPRGWVAGGCGKAPRRLLCWSPAGRRPRPAGWGPYGPEQGAQGAERADAGRRSGHGRRQARRTGAPPEVVFSACTAGGSAALRRRRAPGASPAFSSRSGRGRARKPRDSPAHTLGDQGGRSGGGGSVPGSATDGGQPAGRPPPPRAPPLRGWRLPARHLPPRSGGAGVSDFVEAGLGVRVQGKVAAALRADRLCPRVQTGCARVVRASHFLHKQLPITTERVSTRRCLQAQLECATCTSPTQDGSSSTTKRPRGASRSLAPLSLQAYFGDVCGRVPTKSRGRGRGHWPRSRRSYGPGRTAGSSPRAPSSARPTGAAAAAGDWLRRSGPAPRPAGVGGGGAPREEARRLGVWAAGWTHLARQRYGLLVPGPRAAGRGVAGVGRHLRKLHPSFSLQGGGTDVRPRTLSLAFAWRQS